MSLKTLLPFPIPGLASSGEAAPVAIGPAERSALMGSPDHESTVTQMLGSGRCALLLRPQIAQSLTASHMRRAWQALRDEMCRIDGGPVMVTGRNWLAELDDTDRVHPKTLVTLEAYWLDRFLVTNHQYQAFVRAGGYQQVTLWDEEIRSSLDQFVDQTGRVGPRYWRDGRWQVGHDHHPVVGVSFYEATAYARWIGKRLPTDAEWVKAASWPTLAGVSSVPRKFPWGDVFDKTNANLWESGVGTTSAVDEYPSGASPCGARQLIGNVWEWTSSDFAAFDQGPDIDADAPLKSLRGGAFDTYFPHQASWRFQSGDHLLARRHNVGFRCALCACDIASCTEDLL